MTTLIPERTIDSLLAYELIRAVPDGIIWSPTNTRGSWDHQFATGSTLYVFECKAIHASAQRQQNWRVPIDVIQLHDYLYGPTRLDLTYLLPCEPTDPAKPWVRTCTTDPVLQAITSGGRMQHVCGACWEARGPVGSVRPTRRWAGLSPHVAAARPHLRLQPWFNHWAWCIKASALWAHLYPTARKRTVIRKQIAAAKAAGRKVSKPISARDAAMALIRGADRLCHVTNPTAMSRYALDLPAQRYAERAEHGGSLALFVPRTP